MRQGGGRSWGSENVVGRWGKFVRDVREELDKGIGRVGPSK